MDRNRLYMLLGDLGILLVALIWGTTKRCHKGRTRRDHPALVLRIAFCDSLGDSDDIFRKKSISPASGDAAEEHSCRDGLHLRLPLRGRRPALHYRRQPVLYNFHVSGSGAALRLDHH